MAAFKDRLVPWFMVWMCISEDVSVQAESRIVGCGKLAVEGAVRVHPCLPRWSAATAPERSVSKEVNMRKKKRTPATTPLAPEIPGIWAALAKQGARRAAE